MKRTLFPSLSRPAVILAFLAANSCPALAPTEWQHRQALNVAAPGLVRVDLTAASFDAALPDQEDLRITDAAGREIALLLDRPPAQAARVFRPSSVEVKLEAGTTRVTIATGTAEKLSSVSLETPSPFFLRAAGVETSDNGSDWTLLDQGIPIFREWGAERLDLPLGRRSAAYVRVTIFDNRGAPLPITGARVLSVAAPAPGAVPVGARISSRDEFAGETVLTVALDGRNLPLAVLGLDTREPLFMRRVSVAVREVRDAIPGERIIGSGTIFRVALDGARPREQLELPLSFAPATREILVHIHNGDSPPLSIDAVQLKRQPLNLLFMAPSAGTYTLLSGNPQAEAPHYDLAAFAGELRGATAAAVVPGAVEDAPDYHPRESLGSPPMPDVPLTGAPLDARDWAFRRTLLIAGPGVQELELDIGALAGSRPDFGDLRLLREGNQIPYVLEQPGLARSLDLPPETSADPKRPTVSTWSIRLPRAGLPVRSVVLASTTSLFQRQFRIFEKRASDDGNPYEYTLASGLWSRTPEPGVPGNRVFSLQDRVHADTLWIETDNGDNPAIALGSVQVVYPVVRLVFKVAETDGFELAYGNKSANAPVYDLSLVAVRLLTSSRAAAHTAAEESRGGARNPFAGINGGIVFWGALALVVVALLFVVARLLPKPPG
ncbi:MAG TPA: DUF3999 family protein [Opitutaceae bacterium]|nr:DUF3999 family protein [Opitutaceae bacterium]